jgi:hypothetical protein
MDDLFGHHLPALRDRVKVRREMLVDEARSTSRAWRLAWPPPDGDKPVWQWIPKAICERGRGQDAKYFTMLKSAAQDRGWL